MDFYDNASKMYFKMNRQEKIYIIGETSFLLLETKQAIA